ncbi:ATP-binding protein [Jannaschia donghaensis]
MTKDGPQSARILLSDAVNGRQEVFVLPADEQPDDQVALDTLPVALLRLDANGSVIFANRLARDLLPAIATTSERRLAALVEGLGRSVREWVSEAAAGRGLYRAEVVRVTGAEVETYLQITLGRPVGDADGGLLAVVNDATELKTLEAQFVQSQKMQAIGQLAGGVAHDFNNLLTAISGHCDLLMLRHGEGDEDYADLTQITQNANRAAALVGQLLAFSRKQTLEMRPIDLRDTLGDLAHLLNRLVGERVILRLHHDPALIPIRGDRRQLEQVLMNLVVNARDAMPTGGEILISTECRYLDSPVRRDRVTVPSGQYVVVSVTDQGEGISPDNLSRIFEPFFTTKRPGEGTGLGLSMAYGIVKQSGGYIFADSPPGEGTQFSLFFPALGEESLLELEKSVGHPVPLAEQPHDMAISSDMFSGSLDAQQENPPGPKDHEPTVTAPAVDDLAKDDAFDADPDEISADVQDDENEINQVVGMASEGPLVDEPHSDALKRDAPGNDGDMGENHAAGDDPDGDDLAYLLDKVLSGGGEMDQSDDIDPVPAAEPASVLQSQDKTPTASGRSADWSETERSRPVVLLVEDEAPVRAFASRALRLRGYEVHEAESAEAALAHLEDQTLNVDVFVTDVMMPGLDGPTWVRQAMKDRPDVRTIFISGYTQDALSETSVPVPNSVFLPKPFSLADLTRTVERALS